MIHVVTTQIITHQGKQYEATVIERGARKEYWIKVEALDYFGVPYLKNVCVDPGKDLGKLFAAFYKPLRSGFANDQRLAAMPGASFTPPSSEWVTAQEERQLKEKEDLI